MEVQAGLEWSTWICQTLTNSAPPIGDSLHLLWEDVDDHLVECIHVTLWVYPVNGRTYSSVCGRINAYQREGSSNGFFNYIFLGSTLDQSYISGVSVTHGPAGNRTHIWSFVGAEGESSTLTPFNCPCTNTKVTWPYQVPAYINNDYFWHWQ